MKDPVSENKVEKWLRKTSIPNVASICTDTHMGEGERKEEKKRGRGEERET